MYLNWWKVLSASGGYDLDIEVDDELEEANPILTIQYPRCCFLHVRQNSLLPPCAQRLSRRHNNPLAHDLHTIPFTQTRLIDNFIVCKRAPSDYGTRLTPLPNWE